MVGPTPEGAVSVRRLPEKATLDLEGREVAGGMYQRSPALERAAGPIFMDFVTAKSAKSQVSSPNPTQSRLVGYFNRPLRRNGGGTGGCHPVARSERSGDFGDSRPERRSATSVTSAGIDVRRRVIARAAGDHTFGRRQRGLDPSEAPANCARRVRAMTACRR